jgi:alpha-L-rhamnosidase
VNQKDYPGYGYMLENGATTLWENWELPDQNSLNHPMFGSVSEWFYRSLLGINPKAGAVGFDRIYIRPYIVGDLFSAKGNYHSVRGDVACAWKVKDDLLELDIHIPPNMDADIHIPTSEVESILVDGIPVAKRKEMEFIEYTGSYAIYHVGNGAFHIQSKR